MILINGIGNGCDLHAPVRIRGVFNVDAGAFVADSRAEITGIGVIHKPVEVSAHLLVDTGLHGREGRRRTRIVIICRPTEKVVAVQGIPGSAIG